MAALMDMEELLAKVSNPGMTGYLREAMSCYGAGAYRGCIVLSYIALFDDMRAKLAHLSTINKVARAVHNEVETRANDQDVFETFMADKLKKEGFLTAAEHTQLDIVRQIRNRAAHPSGVVAKAEEARYVFRVVIEDFLAQPLLKTTQAVDALTERLDGSNFFPTVNMDDIVAISKQSLEGMHPEAYGYLVAKLVKLVKGPDAPADQNADRMLIGLARLGDPQLMSPLRSIALVKLSHDSDFAKTVGRLIAANADLLAGLKEEDVIRVRALLEANIATKALPNKLTHPAKQLAAMIDKLGEDAVFETYETFAEKVAARFPYHADLLEAARTSPLLTDQIVGTWKSKAKSSDYATANTFAEALPDLDEYSDLLKGIEAVRIFAGVVDAAETGAFSAKSARQSKFSLAPNIREIVVDYIKAKPKTATTAIEKILPGTKSKDFLKDELIEDE